MLAVEIEGYRIESEFAAGGGVQLLHARQVVADAPVLLQLWEGSPGDARATIRVLAGLRHPGLATVLDVGETRDGHAYAALAVPGGPSLRQQLAAGCDLEQSLALLRRLTLVLQFIESRCALRPCLEPGEVLIDAQGRPVLTRLLSATASASTDAATSALIRLFHEALTGQVTSDPHPRLPDYLSRWQPVLDLLAEPTPITSARILATLDALQGRAGDVRGPAIASKPRPPAVAPAEAVAPAPRKGEASKPARRSTPAPAAPIPPPAPPVAPHAGAVAPADTVAGGAPVRAAAERITAPSRRLDSEPARTLPGARAVPAPSPPAPPVVPVPPSRLPLILAAVLAVPVLAGLGWWLVAPATVAPVADVVTAPVPASGQGTVSAEAALDRPREQSLVEAAEARVSADSALGDASDIDVRSLPTVEDPLERLLLYARTNVQAGRLIEPPGRNALDRYLQALRIEADNRAARAGIAELGALCLRQATEAEDLDLRLAALGCVERVAGAHEAAVAAAEGAKALRRSEHDRFLRAGHQALAGWRQTEASTNFGNALRLLPDSSEARAGAREAERQGRPGYRFHDPLPAGARGPELLVIGGLAWGRSELRVDEFEIYWTAAGRARFGADMPACRDRESMLRSSRKRDWRAPDFPQTAAHPVACVSFGMAQHYAEWLSETTGQRYRLPTLAEWQAVAGSAPGECRANFRDQSAARAWNARDAAACDDGHAHTSPVQAAGETAGLLGLWGNLAEWLADCDGGNCRQRLAAGGSWFSAVADARPSGFAAEPGFTTIGVRVVREIPARD